MSSGEGWEEYLKIVVTMSSLFLGSPLTPHLATSFLNGPYNTSCLIWIWDIFKTSQRRHVKDVFLEIIWDIWKMSQKRHLSWDAFETSQRCRKKDVLFKMYLRCLKKHVFFEMSLSTETWLRCLMPAGLWIFTSVKWNLATITTL